MKRIALALLAGSLLVLSGPAQASAAGGATFALHATDPGRGVPYMVFDARRGTTLRTSVRVENVGDATGTVRLYAVDATTGRTTGAVYKSRGARRRDVGAWSKIALARVTIAPHGSQVVPIDVKIPRGARSGQHLGGIVAEDASVSVGSRQKGSRRQGFKINVRRLTILALQVDLPGRKLERIRLTGVRPGAEGGFPSLEVGIRNEGNRLVKGRGRLVVHARSGRKVKDARFNVDTLVPGTRIQDPVPLPGRQLKAGAYRATVTVRYGHAHTARLRSRFRVGRRGTMASWVTTPAASGDAAGGGAVPWLLIGLGSAALLAVGFGAGAAFLKLRARPA